MAEMSAFQINAKIEELQNKDLDPQVLVDTLESLELTRNEKLDGAGIKELVTSEHIFRPRDYKPSVVVDKLADLPKEYITYIEDVKANKKKLYEDLKADREINGAQLKANRGTTIK